MSKILSFIIPSYNVEKYLTKALDSFAVPELETQIEVIVVDDGSSDGTALIARSYLERFPNIFRLLQKENGGHGSAINEGSRIASGKFIKIVDADDWVVTEHLKSFMEYLAACNSDVVLTPFHMVDMNTGAKTFQHMYLEDNSHIFTPDEIASDWKAFDRCTTFHGITYKTAFYNEYRHELPEKVFYEDQEYATIPFCYARRVSILDLTIYQYLVGNSQQSVSQQNQVKRIHHLKKVIDDMLEYWKENQGSPGFSENYWIRKAEGTVLSYYMIMCILNPEKSSGRRLCAELNQRLKRACLPLYTRVLKKYHLYVLFSWLQIGPQAYERMIHSFLFRLLRHNHKIEKE